MQLRWLLGSLLVACGGSKGGDDIPLAEVKDEAYGYAISVPEGAKQTEKEKSRHVWSWSPDQHINSYHCILENERGLPGFTIEEARKRVELVRAKREITRAEKLGTDGLIVELAEDDHVHYRESWGFRRGKTRTIVAICAGPAKGNTVTAMATSLRVLE